MSFSFLGPGASLPIFTCGEERVHSDSARYTDGQAPSEVAMTIAIHTLERCKALAG